MIVIDMDMPKSCSECRLLLVCATGAEAIYCEMAKTELDSKPSDCPIVAE